MAEKKIDPIRPTDAEARALARRLIDQARHAALAVIEPGTSGPMVTRVGIGTDTEGHPLTLISSLSQHTTALNANPGCSLLLGEPGDRGDPLTHPRLTLICQARPIPRDDPRHADLRARWLQSHPKSKLYIDFADFSFVVFETSKGLLNGGFGQAYRLIPDDLFGPGN